MPLTEGGDSSFITHRLLIDYMQLQTIEWHSTYGLDQALVDQAEHDARLWCSTMADAVQVFGEILERQKEALPHGAFMDYCVHRLGISQQKASVMMRASRTLRRPKAEALRAACKMRALSKLADATDKQLQEAITLAASGQQVTVDIAAEIMGHKKRPDAAAIGDAVTAELRRRDEQKLRLILREILEGHCKNVAIQRLVEAGVPYWAFMPEDPHDWMGWAPEDWKTLEWHSWDSYREVPYKVRRANELLVDLGYEALDPEQYVVKAVELEAQLSDIPWKVANLWLGSMGPDPLRWWEQMWCLWTGVTGEGVHPDDWHMPDDWDPTVVPDDVQAWIAEGKQRAEEWRRSHA